MSEGSDADDRTKVEYSKRLFTAGSQTIEVFFEQKTSRLENVAMKVELGRYSFWTDEMRWHGWERR